MSDFVVELIAHIAFHSSRARFSIFRATLSDSSGLSNRRFIMDYLLLFLTGSLASSIFNRLTGSESKQDNVEETSIQTLAQAQEAPTAVKVFLGFCCFHSRLTLSFV